MHFEQKESKETKRSKSAENEGCKECKIEVPLCDLCVSKIWSPKDCETQRHRDHREITFTSEFKAIRAIEGNKERSLVVADASCVGVFGPWKRPL